MKLIEVQKRIEKLAYIPFKEFLSPAQVQDDLNQIMLSFFGQQSSLNIVHPIAIYYE